MSLIEPSYFDILFLLKEKTIGNFKNISKAQAIFAISILRSIEKSV